MTRPHLEFVQSQNVDWEKQLDGCERKPLSLDPDSTDSTVILRLPPGFERGALGTGDPAMEFFVLDGKLQLDGRDAGLHFYAFVPQESGLGAISSAHGATLLMIRHAVDDPNAMMGAAEPIALDTMAMEWDTSTYDARLVHLKLARKILRLGPDNSCRTFLLTGLPHGVPPETELAVETHDHCEEAFMLQGEMWAPEGRMRPGAYFFRPPGIEHGPHVSETGFMQFMRSPGTNAIVTKWSDKTRPLPIGAAHDPVLPEGLPASWAKPIDDFPPY